MTSAEKYFNELTAQIPDAKAGKMFSALCLKMRNGKVGAMFWKDNIVVKLSGEDFQKALSLAGTKPFEPMEGRVMNGWLQIPFTHKAHWKSFAELSAKTAAAIRK